MRTLLIVVLVAIATSARASIQYGSIDDDVSIRVVAFDKFDPINGSLNHVRLSWSLRTNTEVVATNPNSHEITVRVHPRGYIAQELPFGQYGAILADLGDPQDLTLGPHETVTLTSESRFNDAVWLLDITNPDYLSYFVGPGTFNWGIFVGPQLSATRDGFPFPVPVDVRVYEDLSVEYNGRASGAVPEFSSFGIWLLLLATVCGVLFRWAPSWLILSPKFCHRSRVPRH